MEIFDNVAYIWLAVGAILIIAEFTILPLAGFLFAGLGALIAGLLIETGIVNDPTSSWIIFFASTLIWAVLLWKPLANFRTDKSGNKYIDMVGEKAIVIEQLVPGKTGRAKWSGTIMNAKLDQNITESFGDGAELHISRVEGNILILK